MRASSDITSEYDGNSTIREHGTSSPSHASVNTKNDSPKSTATTSTTVSSTTSTSATSGTDPERHQNRKVFYIRLAMIATLVTATALVSSLVGSYVSADERSNFELQYTDSVSEVAEAFQHRINTKHDIAKSFSAMITSRYGSVAQKVAGEEPTWPNATMPDFQEVSEGMLRIAAGRALSFNPIITQDVNRVGWEAHAVESAWMLEDERLVDGRADDTDVEWPEDRTVSFGIYSRDLDGKVVYDPGYTPESKFKNVMIPVWQIAPIETNEKAVMFNLHSEANRRQALDHMMEHKVPALTAILQLVQDADTRPSSILFNPVFDTFHSSKNNNEDTFPWDHKDINTGEEKVDEDEDEDESGQKVVGSVSIVFSWDTLLDKILPNYIKGMLCVLQSSTGQSFSYSISGQAVTLLGIGDKHDAAYDQYGRHFQANLLLEDTQEFITYQLHMYPSREFEAQYITNRAGIYAAGAVLIFLFTSVLFLMYDYLVEDRQKRTVRLARQTSNIVEGMFPARFRERLYSIHSGSDVGGASALGSSRQSSMDTLPVPVLGGSRAPIYDADIGTVGRNSISSGTSSAVDDLDTRASIESGRNTRSGGSILSLSRSSFLKSPGGRRSASSMGSAIRSAMGSKIAMKQSNAPSTDTTAHERRAGGYFDDEPIAELFLGTSIMFSDIVGFTKWSSERSPNEVFRLLEQLFWEFDDIAARHNIFKLGTIGDCYIAVTGIPDPIVDHAPLLARFAIEARDKFREVIARLDTEEGLDTAKLDMRFGIHSGATTAGILRGTKSRFELFGDTINTASRMESTGMGGKIHVSEETAELIRKDGKARWLHKRDTMIEAKGKGRLQTYWVEPDRASHRVSFSKRLSNFFKEDMLREANGCNAPFYQLDSSLSSRSLSRWDKEEKIEEEDAEVTAVDLSGASKSGCTKQIIKPDDDHTEMSKTMMADENV